MLINRTVAKRARTLAWVLGAALTAAAQHPAQLPMDLPESVADDGGRLDSPPQLTKRGVGRYPEHLVRANNNVRGQVRARVLIDQDGAVESVNVQWATHPAFVSALITQLSQSRFAAARRGGRPVRASGLFVALFDVTGSFGESVGAGVISTPTKPTDLPPDRQYDYAPLMLRFCEPAYPFDALVAKRDGEVKLRVFLDAREVVERTEVVSTSAADFALAMQAAVETWQFVPAATRTGPTPSMFYVERKFFSAGYRRPVAENVALKLVRKSPEKLATPNSLERSPRPIYRVAPQYPRALLAERPEGEATVEFVIYETGEVALPRIIAASRMEFGFAAMNAIQQWVFTPPIRQGRAASVRTQMTFSFKP